MEEPLTKGGRRNEKMRKKGKRKNKTKISAEGEKS